MNDPPKRTMTDAEIAAAIAAGLQKLADAIARDIRSITVKPKPPAKPIAGDD